MQPPQLPLTPGDAALSAALGAALAAALAVAAAQPDRRHAAAAAALSDPGGTAHRVRTRWPVVAAAAATAAAELPSKLGT